jgi:hypothetical protein
MAYITPDDLKAWLRIKDSADDVEIELAISAAELLIDNWCSRGPGAFAVPTAASARTYSGDGMSSLDVDDFANTTGLVIKTDEDGDGVFESTWAATDYQLEPINNFARSWPVWRLRAIGNYGFPRSAQSLVQVTARWGWPVTPAAVQAAAKLEASRILRRRDAVFGVIEIADGALADRIFQALDPTSRILLDPYRRMELG